MRIEDIKYLLAKKGISFTDIGRKHKFRYGTTRLGVSIPSRKAEEALSKALGISAFELFPQRYNKEGKRYKPQPSENYRYKTMQEVLVEKHA